MNKWKKIGLAVGMGTAVITATHAINKFIFNSATSKNYTGKRFRKTYQWKFGDISYITCGEGLPILLVHDLKSYSSSYEWDRVIDILSENHKVYAIDLLGCGHSDKPNITYTTYMYTQLINDFVINVIHKKTDVIVTGNSAPMILMSAYTNNLLFNKIIMVSPQSVRGALAIPDKFSNIRKHLLNLPVIGTTIYNICMNRRNLSNILRNEVFENGIIPTDVLDAYHENAHLSGAVAKFLYTSTECHYTTVAISKAVSELNICMYIVTGMQENNSVIEEYLNLNPAIEVYKIQDSKELPQIEQPIEFVRQADIFLA